MEKRYNFMQAEKEMQDMWEQAGIYRFDPDADGPVYSIDTPPPTVSGSLHIGHLFSYTQAEIIARFHRMQGENVFYPFGFDDNGLPTERLVERDAKIRARSLPRSVFNCKCTDTTRQYEADFRDFWKSLGFSVDWDTQYQTNSPEIMRLSQSLFLELVSKGKAYHKESPMLWCTECRTSIAQAELDTADTESTFNFIPFRLHGDESAAYLEAATTRPELLHGCVCLFVHPDDERYRSFIGKSVHVPLYEYTIPVLADNKVSMEKGTGVVMCATYGDSMDAQWCEEYGLPYRRVILPDGTIAEDVPLIGNMQIPEARKEIQNLLRAAGLLLRSEALVHTVGTHERCGTPIEILPSRQWYIDILSDRDRYLEAADEINWYPPSMKSRYTAWVENLKWDWCISRQRYFGVPFPVWYCQSCGRAAFAGEEQLPVNPMETAYHGSCACGCREFIPETAVFDTWATSSITPQIHERLGLKLTPMSMRTHAHEIIRTWTFYTIVRSLCHTGRLPWKDLMICGFVLAKKGEKISKSKNNNACDPRQLITAHSADVLRYWTAGARLGTDTFFSEDELSVSKRFITKLWNAARFAVSHLQDMEPLSDPEGSLPADRWMIARTRETIRSAAALLSVYEIGQARQRIDELFWNDFCDTYIELVKERLYRPDLHGEQERRSAQHALCYTLFSLLKLYSIYVPHITEYIYQDFFRQHGQASSIHLLQWEKPDEPDASLLAFGELLKAALFDMRKIKSEHNLSMKSDLDRLKIRTGLHMEWFRQTRNDLAACSHARELVFTES